MKLVATGRRWNGKGSLEATVTLFDDSETPLFEDSVNLSSHPARRRFAQELERHFPEIKGKDVPSQLLQLLWEAKSQQEEVEGKAPGRKLPQESQADKLVKLVEKNQLELFHTPTGIAYARIPIGGHAEIHRCRSQGFKQWLSRQLYLTEGKSPNSDALNSAIITIEGKAIFDGEEYALHNRVAFHEGAIFYDLADKAWRAVKITPEGWGIVDTPPILFARYNHQKPQVEPARYGDPWRILDFVNLTSSLRLLFMVYVASAFIPDIPHPIIHLHGDQGAAKTTLFKIVNSVVDPSAEQPLMIPKSENELAQKLYHHWVCYFDNLTSLSNLVSDMFSAVVTGIGFGKRELFTDEGDIIWQMKRVIGLNGINVVATKPDLLDRCILFELERIPGDRRKEEREFLAEFEEAKPGIMAGFFNILSEAKRIYPDLQLKTLHRMGDFDHWGAAIAEALGHSAGEFLNVYAANIKGQNRELLASNPVASVLLSRMEDKDAWQGTPAELLEELESKAEHMKIKTNVKGWPGAPHVLTKRLNELRSNLRQGGIAIDTGGHGQVEGTWKRIIRIWKTEEDTPLPKGSENSVGSVVASAPDRETYLQKTDARPTLPTPEKETPDAGRPKPTLGENLASATPLPDIDCPQIQTDATDASDAEFPISWKGGDAN